MFEKWTMHFFTVEEKYEDRKSHRLTLSVAILDTLRESIIKGNIIKHVESPYLLKRTNGVSSKINPTLLLSDFAQSVSKYTDHTGIWMT